MTIRDRTILEDPQDQAVFDIIAELIKKGKVDNTADFCERVGMFKQSITEIKKGMRHFNVKQIGEICRVFNVNANYIYGFSPKMFRFKAKAL